MKQLKLRWIRQEDSETFKEWIENNPENDFDKSILQYPTLRVLCAYRDDGTIAAFLPIQRGLILESTARGPSLSQLESAQCLRDFTKAAELIADEQGIREIYFLCRDESLSEMAKHHGFEEMPFKVLRMKLY